MELQRAYEELKAARVALFAISYDSLEILEKFSREHHIGYSLLSDTGSHVIRRLGLLNPTVQQDHAFYGIAPNPRHVDLPYPGVFVLDEHGTVTLKRFHESYRVRDTGGNLVSQVIGDTAGSTSAQGQEDPDGVRIRAWTDSPTYAWFQQLRLTVEVTIPEGFHVYGRPVLSLAVFRDRIATIEHGMREAGSRNARSGRERQGVAESEKAGVQKSSSGWRSCTARSSWRARRR